MPLLYRCAALRRAQPSGHSAPAVRGAWSSRPSAEAEHVKLWWGRRGRQGNAETASVHCVLVLVLSLSASHFHRRARAIVNSLLFFGRKKIHSTGSGKAIHARINP
jgi:hypothetical protein